METEGSAFFQRYSAREVVDRTARSTQQKHFGARFKLREKLLRFAQANRCGA
jgi:hypothetical protein